MTIQRALLYAALFLVLLPACAGRPRPNVVPQSPARTVAPRHVDAKAQQEFYDVGLQHYSRDNYEEAKAAFQHVVDLGPNTPLAAKAQENLRKIEQIMKTLEDIRTK